MSQTRNLPWLFLMLFILAMPLSAQLLDETVEDEATAPQQKRWHLLIGYTLVDDPNFASDALDLEASWYVIDGIELDFPALWEQASLSLGPSAAIRVNSGILSNQDYSEQIMVWSAGIATRIDYPESHLKLDINAGELYSYYLMKSGYEAKKNNFFMAGKLAYHQYAGRLQGEWLFPTWNIVIAGGLPWSDQVVFDWGYNEFEHRQNETGQNINSIHGQIELGLVDIPFSETFITCLKARGMGGKYNANIKYWGLGGGVDLVIDNVPMLYLNMDKIWGWDNSKFNNWNIGLGIYYSFFEQLW